MDRVDCMAGNERRIFGLPADAVTLGGSLRNRLRTAACRAAVPLSPDALRDARHLMRGPLTDRTRLFRPRRAWPLVTLRRSVASESMSPGVRYCMLCATPSAISLRRLKTTCLRTSSDPRQARPRPSRSAICARLSDGRLQRDQRAGHMRVAKTW